MLAAGTVPRLPAGRSSAVSSERIAPSITKRRASGSSTPQPHSSRHQATVAGLPQHCTAPALQHHSTASMLHRSRAASAPCRSLFATARQHTTRMHAARSQHCMASARHQRDSAGTSSSQQHASPALLRCTSTAPQHSLPPLQAGHSMSAPRRLQPHRLLGPAKPAPTQRLQVRSGAPTHGVSSQHAPALTPRAARSVASSTVSASTAATFVLNAARALQTSVAMGDCSACFPRRFCGTELCSQAYLPPANWTQTRAPTFSFPQRIASTTMTSSRHTARFGCRISGRHSAPSSKIMASC